jgi:short-subunit dehydrogenase
VLDLVEKYGRWALITGASSGIGREFARYLAKINFNLILVARRYERLLELSDELTKSYPIEIICIKADLTKEECFPEIFEKVGEREVGLLVNNAGVGSVGLLFHLGLQKEIDLVKLNCLAPTILTHYFLKKMIERKRGAIIFLGSIVGMQPTPYLSVYSASKSFNIFLANALWYELKKFNIDVLALSPGSTNTEFERVSHETSRLITAEPDEVVRTAFRALGKKPAVVNGFINKLLITIGKFLPGRVTVTLAGIISYMRNNKNKFIDAGKI